MNNEFEVKVLHDKPTIYDELHRRFGVEWDDKVIITFYPYVYCKVNLTPEKIIHESVHLKQQALIGVDIWWKNFLLDPVFRLQEELAAHRAEAQFIIKYIKNKNDQFQYLHRIAMNLSSSMYGKLITYQKALKLIKQNN